MSTVNDRLRDADPLAHEPPPGDGDRDRLRQMAVAAASRATGAASMAWFRAPLAIVALVALILVAILAIGSRSGSNGNTTLYAAVRFEARLAEDRAAPGLQAARVAGSDRIVYLHPEVIVGNDDVESSAVTGGLEGDRSGVVVRFNAAGARKMQQATARNVGKALAILIDGEVVMAPVLRDPISGSAVISGDFTRAEAERIAHGIGVPLG